MKLKYIMSAVVAVFMLSACSTEPDEANFHSFTGQTVGDSSKRMPSNLVASTTSCSMRR